MRKPDSRSTKLTYLNFVIPRAIFDNDAFRTIKWHAGNYFDTLIATN